MIFQEYFDTFFVNFPNRIEFVVFTLYSRCPKTGRPVWQTGRKYVRISNIWLSDVRLLPICPVIGQIECNWTSDNRTILSGYRTFTVSQTSEIRTKSSGFRTFGQLYLQTGLEPVPNRFVDTIARTFEIWTILSGFQTSGSK